MSSAEIENSGGSEFSWGKKRGVGGRKKDVQFYESFTYDGVEYTLYDCVYMQNKDREADPYIGKLIKIWENPDNTKKIKVQWFFRPSEISYWLEKHNVEALENELFFASGDGPGLANINPLEAIAGKCFVVCISRHDRNPQPSEEQLQMADYVFYRSFDVGQHNVLDKMDDKVGGLEVRFVFNRQENGIDMDPILGSKLKENDSWSVVVCEETVQHSGKKPHEVLKSIKRDGNHNHLDAKEDSAASFLLSKDEISNEHAKDSLDHLKPRVGKRPALVFDRLSGEVATSNSQKNSSADVNAATKLFKDSSLLANPGVVGETLDPPNLDDRSLKRAKLDDFAKFAKGKDRIKVEESTSNQGDLKTSSVISTKEKTKPEPVRDTIGVDKHKKSVVDFEAFDGRPSKKLKFQESVKLAEDKNKNNFEKANLTSGSKAKGSLVAGSSVEDTRKARLAQNSTALDNGPSKEKLNGNLVEVTKNLAGLEKIHTKGEPEENMKKITKSSSKLDKGHPSDMRELKFGECSNDSNGLDKGPSEGKPNGKKDKLMKNSFGLEKGPSEEKLDEKIRMLPNNSSTKISRATVDLDDKIYGKIFEVTQRPDAEMGKWFKSPEGRIVDAHEQRRLVLLQNLDPKYTSGEVEDVIWNAFEESCTAKVVQQAAFSSRLYGQALVIFRSRDVAERVVGKLNEGCLLLTNRRPLVGCIANLPQLQGKQSIFYGPLSMDEIGKNKTQMLREKKDAISTPHCSQPNSIEYELAMEWCLLQSRSDFWWLRLHKAQGKEYKKLVTEFKSNSIR